MKIQLSLTMSTTFKTDPLRKNSITNLFFFVDGFLKQKVNLKVKLKLKLNVL